MTKNTTLQKFLLFISIAIVGIFHSQKSAASHGMGGEITWSCLPGGQFIFEMKAYRDCNGITMLPTISLSTNVPSATQIPLTLFAQNDISPDGFISNGTTLCPNCTQGNSGTPIPGLVEEYIYRSVPTTLPGVPPATGWIFQWTDCCRSNSLTNLASASSFGFQNRAIMYPYQGTSTNPCFDSSPYFAERPSVITCTGQPYKYNSNAIDPEQDSLVYSWGAPLDDLGAIIPFAPGYSVTSQLPSPTQNSNNVAAVLNPATGEVSYTSFTGGYFATVIKVTAYKCGIKVAEIIREINVVLNNTCPPISGGLPNNPPVMSAPFPDPVSGLMTSYVDTVTAGDTSSFLISITDFDLFTNGNVQNITLEGSGSQFGINFINPDSGCVIPPCAVLTSSLPISFNFAGSVGFNWVTTCDHVTGINAQCVNPSATYYFVLKAHDNYCPANATTLATISIIVVGIQPVVTATGPSSICTGDTVVLSASGALSYIWNTGQSGNSIVVTQPGFYSVTGITPGVCSGTTDIFIPPGNLPNVTASAPMTTMCINSLSFPMTGTPAGGVWTGPGITGNIFNPATAGVGIHDVIYTISDTMWCFGSDTLKMVVNLCTGLEEDDNGNGVFVYPNPAVDQITLVISDKQSQATKIELYNAYGQMVMEVFDGKIDKQQWEMAVDISKLKKGMYVFRLNGTSMQNAVFVK